MENNFSIQAAKMAEDNTSATKVASNVSNINGVDDNIEINKLKQDMGSGKIE